MVNWKALPVANRRQFVRFHPADFMAAVQPYSAAVAGAYILALCKYWEAGAEGLPNDLLKAARKRPGASGTPAR